MLAPTRTPAVVVAQLHAALSTALAEPAVMERLTGLGFAITALSPEAFRARARAVSETLGPVVRSLGT